MSAPPCHPHFNTVSCSSFHLQLVQHATVCCDRNQKEATRYTNSCLNVRTSVHLQDKDEELWGLWIPSPFLIFTLKPFCFLTSLTFRNVSSETRVLSVLLCNQSFYYDSFFLSPVFFPAVQHFESTDYCVKRNISEAEVEYQKSGHLFNNWSSISIHLLLSTPCSRSGSQSSSEVENVILFLLV